MAFDYKKEYKEFYMPKKKPGIVEIPKMNYIAAIPAQQPERLSDATAKKKQDFSKVEFLTYDEGVCVQCMHIGSYDNEPETVELMHKYMAENGYELDITDSRLHHEIYLSDPRRCDESKLKTVIRHPIKKTDM